MAGSRRWCGRRGFRRRRCGVGSPRSTSGERAPEGRVRRPGAGRPSIEEREPGLGRRCWRCLEGGDAWRSRVAASVDEPERGAFDGGVARAGVCRAREHGAAAAARVGLQPAGQPQDARGLRPPRPRRPVPADRRGLAPRRWRPGEPLISVDTKKKELVGNYKNGGRELAPTGEPILVNTHDFLDARPRQGDPVRHLRRRPTTRAGCRSGSPPTPPSSPSPRSRPGGSSSGASATRTRARLTITADCGGSNGYRTRLWKTELQRLADQTGLQIRVLHYPPGTSKWNKIEHRLFSYISINWRAKPLISRQTVIDLIASTTTAPASRSTPASTPTPTQQDQRQRPTNSQPSRSRRDQFHPEWNYTIKPRR